jgi:serine/threonine-protein kinase
MDAERWRKLESLFAGALARAPGNRRSWLARHCDDDAALRREVESLLAALESGKDYLDRHPPGAIGAPAPAGSASLADGEVLGAWRIVGLIGRGGMGEVHEVARTDGRYEQRAALKLIHDAAPESLPRFHAERRILARLSHPGIARLLDGGETADGRPYAVLEYVEGEPITDYCAHRASGVEERVRLLIELCAAVAHAHEHLIVHRDLKPANILVDREGRVRVVDFGIAKALGPGNRNGGDETIPGSYPLTPEYCAPEQLSGEPVTTATDVYALGVVAFELLTGERPWSLKGQPLVRALRSLLDTSARKASDVAGRAASPPVPPRALHGDIDAIVATCLRREAAHRYRTVNALSHDLERHLAGDPVAARSGQRGYELGRFLRRHRAAAAALAAVFVALALGLAGTLWQARQVAAQAERAHAVQEFLVETFTVGAPTETDQIKARATPASALLDFAAGKVKARFAGAPRTRLQVLGLLAALNDGLLRHDQEIALLRQQATLARATYGGDSIEYVRVLVKLIDAMILGDSDAGKIIPLLDEARIAAASFGARHPVDRAHLLLDEANVYWDMDPQRALAAAKASIATHGPQPDDTVLAEAWLARGSIERDAGRPTAALGSIDHAIAILDHLKPGLDKTLRSWAYYRRVEAAHDSGDMDLAESSGHRCIAIAGQDLGTDSIAAARCRLVFAQALSDDGKWRDALAKLSAAEAIVLRLRGSGDRYHLPDIRTARGAVLLGIGRIGEAVALLEGVLAADAPEPRPETRARAREFLAAALIESGRLDQAGTQIESAAAEFRSDLLPIDRSRNRDRQVRFRLALATGDLAGARAQLAAYAAAPGVDAVALRVPWQLRRLLMESRLALASRDEPAAAAAASEALALLDSHPERRDLSRLHATANLDFGLAKLQAGNAGVARPALEAALAERRTLAAPESPKIAEAEIALGRCLAMLGDLDGARHEAGAAHAIHALHPALAAAYHDDLRALDALLRAAPGISARVAAPGTDTSAAPDTAPSGRVPQGA